MRRAAEARSRSVQVHLPTLKGKITHRREVHEQASAQRVLRGRIIPSNADAHASPAAALIRALAGYSPCAPRRRIEGCPCHRSPEAPQTY